jgi:hypothetical protein
MELKSGDTLNLVLHEVKSTNLFGGIWIYLIIAICLIIIILLNLKKIKRVVKNIKPNEYEVNLPGFNLKGKINYKSIDQEVAWKIYIELITRVSSNRLVDNTGILRESLNSLYSAFGSLRETLKNSGAELSRIPKGKDDYTVASLLLIIMNQHFRVFLSKWHPMLQEYEKRKEKEMSQFEHEQKWGYNKEFRAELNMLQDGLLEYIQLLKEISEGKNNLSIKNHIHEENRK